MAKRKSEVVSSNLETSDASTSTTGHKSVKRPKKEGPVPRSDLVDEANDLGWQDFTDRYLDWDLMDYDVGTSKSYGSLQFADQLSTSTFDKCFKLIETTSRTDYEASNWGWHPKRKRKEMKEQEMRYIEIHNADHTVEDGFEGFISFMITHDSTPAVPVLYIYEIHLTEAARGKGLGLHLMDVAESIARKVGVQKVMLTCFLSNTKALNFYKRCGFRTDVCSPEDRRTRNKIVKVDYVIMSKDINSTHADGNGRVTNGNAVQVKDDEQMDSVISDRTDELPSLDDCPEVMRAWIDSLRQQELLDLGLLEAEKARHCLSSDQDQEAAKHRDILSALFQCLQMRYEAARDLDEILREQMYHLKSHISDVDRMAETLTAPTQENGKRKRQCRLSEESFDWDKATEQVYSSFYTLLRKAEEVDNRLDDIVEREQEADQREDDLDGREEELDSWENDIHDREKALAEREERLARSKRRLRRLKGSGSRDTEEQCQFQYQFQYHEQVEEWEGEPVRALPERQEAPPENKVDLWLHHQPSACDDLDVDPGGD